jgi:hypothetical protein
VIVSIKKKKKNTLRLQFTVVGYGCNILVQFTT